MTAYEDAEPLAVWEAAFLGWDWEAYEKEDDGVYYGRVKSPLTYDRWEWGYFTEDQLRTAGAYRTDGEDAPQRFPDGGVIEDLSRVELYETVVDAVQAMDDGGDA
jgi:hypothetical protein